MKCNNCGNIVDDSVKFCPNCGKSLNANNNDIINNDTAKKVKFHWEIPFVLFIQFIIVRLIYSVVRITSDINARECIENCNDSSMIMSIISFINKISTVLAIFVIPSIIIVLIVYLVQKGKGN